MAGYQLTSDLLEDVLFRAGEPSGGTSDFAAQTLRYLNRAQTAIALGGAEFDNTLQEDWWWLRKSPPGVLTLDPVYTTGTITVTNGSPTVTFSVAPVASKATWLLSVGEHPDIFRVSTHTAGALSATLDSPYTGPSLAGQPFRLMHVEYDVASDLMRIVSPLRVNRAQGLSMSTIPVFSDLTAFTQWEAAPQSTAGGVADSAVMVDENTIRFNRYGSTEANDYVRVEYDYLVRPPLLTNAPNEEPVVPLQWRRLVADGALFFLYMDKNDNRTDGVGLLLIKGLKAMARENHHKQAAANGEMGRIRPRQDDLGAWGEREFQVLRP